MAAVPEYLDQVMALQEAGRRSGHMPPRVLMERVPAQIELQLVENGEDSPYFQAFEAMPDTLSMSSLLSMR